MNGGWTGLFELIDPDRIFSRNSCLFPELSGIGTCQEGDVSGRLEWSAYRPFPPFHPDNDTDDGRQDESAASTAA